MPKFNNLQVTGTGGITTTKVTATGASSMALISQPFDPAFIGVPGPGPIIIPWNPAFFPYLDISFLAAFTALTIVFGGGYAPTAGDMISASVINDGFVGNATITWPPPFFKFSDASTGDPGGGAFKVTTYQGTFSPSTGLFNMVKTVFV